MNEDQLRLIESELRITLPADYRETALSGIFPRIGEDYLIDNAEQLLQENREYRASGFHGLPWQPHYYVFGADRDGNRYFFDLSESPPKIWFANRETGDRELETNSFAEWLQFAFLSEADRQDELTEEREEEQRLWADKAAAEARKHEYPQIAGQKTWWQFWK